MMASEFYDRTGIDVVGTSYDVIERFYNDFEGNKDEFCKALMSNSDNMLTKVFRELNKRIKSLEKKIETITKEDNHRINALIKDNEELQKKLDAELDWVDRGTCSYMSDDEYLELCMVKDEKITRFGGCRSPEEFICRECGFELNRIRVVTDLTFYQVNKYKQLRPVRKQVREPLYFASDWNYVCFEVRGTGMTYEYVNGTFGIFEGEEFHEKK